jgi:hypothetical protein
MNSTILTQTVRETSSAEESFCTSVLFRSVVDQMTGANISRDDVFY